MSPSIDVIVPVFGNWQLTEKCLASLRAQTVSHRVIVVDDAGGDDTVERLRAGYPEVTVVALDENLGFAGACNRGIAAGTSPLVVLVNNDVEAAPDMLERLAAAFTDAGVGSAGPLIERPSGVVDAYGICADVTLAGFVRFAGASPADLTSGSRVLGPYGAVAAYRRQALAEVGTFDEGIVMYGEELDLALRLSAAGWATRLVPEARAVHVGGATAGRGSARQRFSAGYGRGYLLRAWGVIPSRHGLRAVATELIVCAGDLLMSRDLASTRGRCRGWRAARGIARPRTTVPGIDTSIGFVESLRMRSSDRAAK